MSNPAPLVTVILPTFNRRKFLSAAIQSIHGQTFPDWRLLVVNDGGEDVSDIVASFSDPRIEYHARPHLGKAAALNFGLGLVHSKYIAYMDDDDIVLPEHIGKLVAFAEERNAEFVYSDTWLVRIGPDGEELRRDVENDKDITFDDIRFANRINHKQILHTKRLADETGPYDERLRILIDYDYIRRLAKNRRPEHLREITGEHYLRLASANPNDFASISGLWISDPEVCGRSVMALFEKDPAALATIYRDANRCRALEARLAATEARLAATGKTLKGTQNTLLQTRKALQDVTILLKTVEGSFSYQVGRFMTAPLRLLFDFVCKMVRKARRPPSEN